MCRNSSGLIEQVTNACLHFHFFEARLRLERPTNDFSQWLRDLGETAAGPEDRPAESLRHDARRIEARNRQAGAEIPPE